MKKYILFSLIIILLGTVFTALSQERRKHIVQPQETAYRIAKYYQVSLADLYRINPGSEEKIIPGQVLLIPSKKKTISRAQEQYHAVVRSETLFSISRQYQVSLEDLRTANPQLKGNHIAVGMILKIPSSAPSRQTQSVRPTNARDRKGQRTTPHTAAPQGLKIYEVQRGQTIYNLLSLTGWTQDELYQYNPILKDGLKAGQSILIPDETMPSLPRIVAAEESQTPFQMPSYSADRIDMVLALPFKEDQTGKYTEYYEGCLLAIKEAKEAGLNLKLTVVDCSDTELEGAIDKISSLGSVDLIMGGLSDNSIRKLCWLAEEKEAKFVIPFSSKAYRMNNDYGIYYINTPHEETYNLLQQRFIEEYGKKQLLFFNSKLAETQNKTELIHKLQQACQTAHIPYQQLSPSGKLDPANLLEISKGKQPLVIVPSSSSVEVAQELLDACIAANKLGVAVEIFSSPEWQIYEATLKYKLAQCKTTFYSMFYVDQQTAEYNHITKAFLSWFGHSPANIYPKYGILGYDITKYFMKHTRPGTQPKYIGELPSMDGIQSRIGFSTAAFGLNSYVNNGILFVSYRNGNKIIH